MRKEKAEQLKRIFFLIISSIIFCGCVSVQSGFVKQKLSKIDYSDGINREEAVIIAQKKAKRLGSFPLNHM